MTIALTGTNSSPGAALAAALAAEHTVIVLDPDLPDGLAAEHRPVVDYDLESLATALAGVDTVVHGACHAPYSTRGLREDHAILDVCGRGTYNVVQAATRQSVGRLILLSTLELMLGYDEDLRVNEQYRTKPTCDPRSLGFHAAERCCSECARQMPNLRMLILRLGRVVLEEEVAGQPYDPLWVDLRDAVEIARRVATHEAPTHRRASHAGVLHIGNAKAGSLARGGWMRRWLEFTPEHNFAASPGGEDEQ